MEATELKRTILDYLDHHHTLSLATEKNGAPHAATVFYVNIGLRLYFLSNPLSRHGRNLSHNPRVAATINADDSNWLRIKGIQLTGRARPLGGVLQHGSIARAYVAKFPDVADFLMAPWKLGREIAQKVAGVAFYELIPGRIYFIDNEQGFGHREELKVS